MEAVEYATKVIFRELEFDRRSLDWIPIIRILKRVIQHLKGVYRRQGSRARLSYMTLGQISRFLSTFCTDAGLEYIIDRTGYRSLPHARLLWPQAVETPLDQQSASQTLDVHVHSRSLNQFFPASQSPFFSSSHNHGKRSHQVPACSVTSLLSYCLECGFSDRSVLVQSRWLLWVVALVLSVITLCEGFRPRPSGTLACKAAFK